ncbi:MAG: DNA-binding IclR family transcriptional regulator [Cellvibrionaceae bacterium]|jgi:DNA-binding IclR family transcriptional regulator
MSYPGTQAIHRAVQLLKLFGIRQTEWTLTELIEETQLNKTTVFRILSALESEGLLERSERNNYQLGPEMVALGGWAIEQNSLIRVAQQPLQALVTHANERVTLEQPIINSDGSHAMLGLTAIRSNHRITVSQIYGTRLPIYATSTGKAYLAYLSPEKQLEALESTPLTLITKTTLVSIDALLAEFAVIKQRGYALALGELEDGLFATGAPLFNYKGEPVAAISMEGPTSRVNIDRLHELAQDLMQTAAEISARLGWRG